MSTRTETYPRIPNDRVPQRVAIIQATPGYISHRLVPHDDGTTTIHATYDEHPRAGD